MEGVTRGGRPPLPLVMPLIFCGYLSGSFLGWQLAKGTGSASNGLKSWKLEQVHW